MLSFLPSFFSSRRASSSSYESLETNRDTRLKEVTAMNDSRRGTQCPIIDPKSHTGLRHAQEINIYYIKLLRFDGILLKYLAYLVICVFFFKEGHEIFTCVQKE